MHLVHPPVSDLYFVLLIAAAPFHGDSCAGCCFVLLLFVYDNVHRLLINCVIGFLCNEEERNVCSVHMFRLCVDVDPEDIGIRSPNVVSEVSDTY